MTPATESALPSLRAAGLPGQAVAGMVRVLPGHDR